MLNYQSSTRENYKYIAVAFRFLFFFLGLFLTDFCSSPFQVNALPPPFDAPVIIVISLMVYQIMASFITLRFTAEKIVLFLVIAADIAFGIFLAYFFGASFFALACILPLVEAIVFLGVLLTLVTAVVMLLIYFPLLGQVWAGILKKPGADALALKESFSAQIKVYSLMALVIVILLYKSFRSEVFVAAKEKEFEKEKEELNRESGAVKHQMKELCNEISNKQDGIQRLHFELQDKTRQLQEVEERLHEIMYQGQELLSMAQTKEDKSVEELKRHGVKIKHRLDYLEERVSSLTKLINIFQNLSLSAHLEETYNNVVRLASEAMPSQTVALFMLQMSNQGMELRCEASLTPYKSYFDKLSFTLGSSAVGWAAQNKKTIVISNGSAEIGGEEMTTLLSYEKSAVIIPMLYNENILGVLYFGKVEAEGFGQEDIERINLFGKLICVALKFVKDYHMDISSGVKDNITNLFTSYYFKERLADEFARLKRYNNSASLIVLSLDNFKAIHEKHNSVVVNSALKEVGDLLMSHSRNTDVVGRWGANDFIILLIQTDKNESILIAERLRMAIGVRIFGKSFGERINAQASIGLAIYDSALNSSDEFLKAAERALLQARQKGGNTTVIG